MPETHNIPKGFTPHPFAYHEIVTLDIHTLTNQGHGLGRLDNWVVIVPFALPGESVKARIYRNHPNYSDADLVAVLNPSPHRTKPACPLFGDCGGCQYQNLAYEQQLLFKQQQVHELLQHMAKIDHPVEPVIPSPAQYGYRSKITPHFQKPKKNNISAIGFLKVGRRQQIVDVPNCPIAAPPLNNTLTELRDDIFNHASRYKKGATLLLRLSGNDVVTDPKELAREQVGEITFEFIAGEFFQNNPSILPAFTRHVAAEASQNNTQFLIDAYCGAGLFALTAAKRFQQVKGVEISELSIQWARHNAQQNHIENAKFLEGRAEAIFDNITFDPTQTAVVIDPPRKGCDEPFLDQLLNFGPSRIVYVSCNPATQMRDLKSLAADGHYRLTRVQPFDLFPQTKHLECVITLEKN
ncbi:MAG: class I SAM-dependent RNA methyltransferase [Verrucomicrobiota bacterium]